MNATTWPVDTSQARYFSVSASGAITALGWHGFSAMKRATFASSGIACSASNALYSVFVTNSGPRASLARKNLSLRWWNAPRSAKHMLYGARRSASSASFAAHWSGRTGLFIATSAVIISVFG